MEEKKPNFVALLIVALVAFLIVKSFLKDSPGPGPTPNNEVIAVVIESMADYNLALSEDAAKLADLIKNKKIKTAESYGQKSRELTGISKQNSFNPVDKLDNKNIPSEIKEENIEDVVEYTEQISEAHKKVYEALKGL